MTKIIPDSYEPGFYITDQARNHEILRGPFQHEETAVAVRREMEDTYYDQFDEDEVHSDDIYHPNYWIVEKTGPAKKRAASSDGGA